MDADVPRAATGGTPHGHRALVLIGASLVMFWSVAVAGPSAVSHQLPRGGLLPPYTLGRHPSAWLVIVVLWLATIAGAAGTFVALRALRDGWTPSPRRLLAAAAVVTIAFAVVPPVNSDDVYSYAAYGRMAAIGRSPYTTAPEDLPNDPVAQAVTSPWREEPTVYGPIATAEQAAVMRVSGASVRRGVMGLAALAGVAFLIVAALLHGYAADDAERRRAALCWALNPLLLFNVVGGAHLDTLGAAAMLVAVGFVARRTWGAAGLAFGAAVAIKLSGGISALGVAWSLRRQPKRLLALVGAGVLVVVPLYLLVGGLRALGPARKSSRFVSHASWWRPLAVQLDRGMGVGTSRAITSALSLALLLSFGWLLSRALPPGRRPLEVAARYALAPTLAWLLTATYTLPWYAAWAWPLLALVAASAWDDVLVGWTAVLTIAYIPGRDVALPAGLAGITRWLRAGFGPLALAALLAAAVVLAVRSRRSAQLTADSAP